jgi:hypothetical protein
VESDGKRGCNELESATVCIMQVAFAPPQTNDQGPDLPVLAGEGQRHVRGLLRRPRTGDVVPIELTAQRDPGQPEGVAGLLEHAGQVIVVAQPLADLPRGPGGV